MKKIAIATLLAATTMVATAQVSLNGKISEFVDNTKTGATSKTTLATDPTSNITISVNENIGGMKARVVLDTSLKANDPITGADTKLGDRQSTIGLVNKLGSIDLGRAKHAVGRALDNYDVFGNAAFSSTTVVNASQGQRLSNAAMVNAVVTKGVSASYQRGETEVAGTSAVNAGSLDFEVAGVNATIVTYDNQVNNTTNLVAAKYTFAPTGTTVAAIYSDNNVAGVKTTGKTIGVAQAVGKSPVTVLASYGTNELVKATNVGVNYALSKTTSLQARYIKEDNVVSTKDLQRVAVGMEMNF